MRAHDNLMWERAESFVDRQLARKSCTSGHLLTAIRLMFVYPIVDRRQADPPHRPDHLDIDMFESGELEYEKRRTKPVVWPKTT